MIIQLTNQKFIDSNIDMFLKKLPDVQLGEVVQIDFSKVEYLRPGTVIQLIILSKMFYQKSEEKVRWFRIPRERAQYLKRLNIEKVDFISVEWPPMFWLYRNDDKEKVVPLEIIEDRLQLANVTAETMRHLNEWFPNKEKTGFCHDAANVVMEIVNNSLDHSEYCTDNNPLCYYTIQKYQPRRNESYQPRVIIAFGDAGIGMRQSLSRRWESVQTDAGAIKAALKGLSSRDGGEGGYGFKRVSSVLMKNNGHLTIRSGQASLHYMYEQQNIKRDQRYHKELLAGTQTAFLL